MPPAKAMDKLRDQASALGLAPRPDERVCVLRSTAAQTNLGRRDGRSSASGPRSSDRAPRDRRWRPPARCLHVRGAPRPVADCPLSSRDRSRPPEMVSCPMSTKPERWTCVTLRCLREDLKVEVPPIEIGLGNLNRPLVAEAHRARPGGQRTQRARHARQQPLGAMPIRSLGHQVPPLHSRGSSNWPPNTGRRG